MQDSADAFGIIFVIVFYAIIFAFLVGIQLLISYFLYRACAAIPEPFRLCSPGQAFLLLIPLFNLVWIFIYTNNLSKSFANFFASQNVNHDDCGEKLGLWWGICGVCGFVPCVNFFSGIAGLVIMIMYLVKVSECRSLALNLIMNPNAPNSNYGANYASPPYKTPGSPNNPYGY